MNNYKKVLPFSDNERVIDQFGWTPLSIINPTKASKNKWKDAYLENTEQKRSSQARWLAGLKFSEFHAGLCENIIHYWSMVDSVIVDPFAGRLTRAYVSESLGRKYYGYDVSESTVEKVNTHLQKHNMNSIIYNEDGCEMKKTPDDFADLVMTCPPYHNIEKYESSEYQLSDCDTYVDFCNRINVCGQNIQRVLKPGGFCVWVCGDWRESGVYRTFHADCISMFKDSGLLFHDLIVMENNSPFAALQMGKCASKRYTSKVHEYILVFRKEGDLQPKSDKIKLKTTNNLEQFFD